MKKNIVYKFQCFLITFFYVDIVAYVLPLPTSTTLTFPSCFKYGDTVLQNINISVENIFSLDSKIWTSMIVSMVRGHCK